MYVLSSKLQDRQREQLALKDSSGKGKRFMPFVSVKSETLNEEKAGEIGYV